MKEIEEMYPEYWVEIANNPISHRYLIRLDLYPQTNSKHMTPENKILIVVGESIESCIEQIVSKKETPENIGIYKIE